MRRVAKMPPATPAPSNHPAVRPSKTVTLLATAILAASLAAALVGLLWSGGEVPASFTSARGEIVRTYGEGLYRYDARLTGAGSRGTDTVTLVLGLPLLAASAVGYARGSLRGALLLLGALTWFLYVYATYALGLAYNELFLLYVALFSASLFGLVAAFRSLDPRALLGHVSGRLPRRALGAFMLFSSGVTLIVWASIPLAGMLQGTVPAGLAGYTTLFTVALDIAVIVPATFLAGVLVLRGRPLGYLLAFPLLVLEALLAPMIAVQTVFQLRAGVSFTLAEIVGPIGGFVLISLLSLWLIALMLHGLDDAVPT